jgi:hypothetical protein
VALVWMLRGVTRSLKKFKMAVDKPEVRMSQLLDMIATPFQWLILIFWVQEFSALLPIPSKVTGIRKFKMAAVKPDVNRTIFGQASFNSWTPIMEG